jgi:hypothetical protein
VKVRSIRSLESFVYGESASDIVAVESLAAFFLIYRIGESSTLQTDRMKRIQPEAVDSLFIADCLRLSSSGALPRFLPPEIQLLGFFFFGLGIDLARE